MNLLDRTIGWFSPAAGLRRARARAALKLVRGYEGAKTGRLTDGWIAAGTSANVEIAGARSRLTARARDLVRNNPFAARIVDIWAANIIGTGIQVQSTTGDKALDTRVDDLWKRFVERSDSYGQQDFYGQQALAIRSVIEGGETLSRFRPRRPEDGLAVPLQIQLLEPDYLDGTKEAITATGGNIISQGIEFNVIDQRVAYWLFRTHPGDTTLSLRQRGFASVRVPAPDVAHLYRILRIGQNRGVSWLAPVMLRLRDQDELNEAVLVKTKIEACFAAFITRLEGEESAPVAPSSTDSKGRRIETFEPGMIEYLRAGEDIKFANPTASGSFEPINLSALMAISVGAGVTYDQLSGDLRQANYSSLRAGKVEQRRLIDQHQWHMAIPMFVAPVRRRFIQTSILAGLLPRRAQGYPVEYQVPGHEAIDPLKDSLADIALVRAGGMTPQQFMAKYGYDWREQLRAIAEFNALADQLKVVLDSDPRKVNDAGALQAAKAGVAESGGNSPR